MSIKVVARAMLDATCQYELGGQLSLEVDPVSELNRLESAINSGQLTRPHLQELISAPAASAVLATLAPEEFKHVRAHTEDGSRSALELTAADLQDELAEVLTAAIMAATRSVISHTFAESAMELGYVVAAHETESVTRIELNRGHEVISVIIRNGGDVEFNHCGRIDNELGFHQSQLEQAAQRHGILVVPEASGNQGPAS